MLAIELVKDRTTKEPAKSECAQILETCKDMGLLLGKGGLWGHVIRLRRRCASIRATRISCSKYSMPRFRRCKAA